VDAALELEQELVLRALQDLLGGADEGSVGVHLVLVVGQHAADAPHADPQVEQDDVVHGFSL